MLILLVVFSDPNHFTFIFSLSIVDTSDLLGRTTYFNKEHLCPAVLTYDPYCYCSRHISTKNNGVPSGIAPLSISMRVRPGWIALGLHLCVLVWAIPHSQNQDIEWIVYLPFRTHTTILVYARSSHYKFDSVWKLTWWSRTPHWIIVHNQRTL